MVANVRTKLALVVGLGLTLMLAAPNGRTGATQRATEPMLSSEWGLINTIEAGWVDDTLAVSHSKPLVNPGKCPVTDGGYVTNPTDPGHNLFHTLILSGFLNRKEVRFLVSGCIFGKPHIISVSIR